VGLAPKKHRTRTFVISINTQINGQKAVQARLQLSVRSAATTNQHSTLHSPSTGRCSARSYVGARANRIAPSARCQSDNPGLAKAADTIRLLEFKIQSSAYASSDATVTLTSNLSIAGTARLLRLETASVQPPLDPVVYVQAKIIRQCPISRTNAHGPVRAPQLPTQAAPQHARRRPLMPSDRVLGFDPCAK